MYRFGVRGAEGHKLFFAVFLRFFLVYQCVFQNLRDRLNGDKKHMCLHLRVDLIEIG